MPIKSRHTIDIPICSLPTYLFGSPSDPLDNEKKQFLDAHNPERNFTRAEFRLWSQRFAAGLRQAGFRSGDRALLFSPNDLFFPIAFMGIVMAGGIFTGANPTFTSRELAYQLKDSEAHFLFCHEAGLQVGLEAARSIGMGKERVFVFSGASVDGLNEGPNLKGCRSWASLFASEAAGKAYIWDDLRSPGANDATLALNYSSGTTGVPKGVEITHKNYVSNTAQMCFLVQQKSDFKEKQPLYRQLCFLPLYHAMAQTIYIANSVLLEIPVYIMPKFDFIQVLRYVEKYRISALSLVPPVVVAMAKHPVVKQYDLSSILAISSGAAPLGREIIAELESRFPASQEINLKQGYGMTEATCSLTGWDPNKISEDSSVGEPNANIEIAIMPPSSESFLDTFDSSKELPRHVRGELWARGPNIMKGYWQKPKATSDTLTRDGWLKTGDICYVDDRNHIFVVDRLKELIKVKGNQVAPAELEAVLLEHPAISDAAVIGVPDATGDERVRAYIVRQANEQGKSVKGEEIVEWMKERSAKHKWITAGVRFVEVIPKNPSGKILRRELREMEKSERNKTRTEEGARL